MMVNRQARTPGNLAAFEMTGRISEGVPSYAVDVGEGFDILARAAGSLSERLLKLAGEAAAREGDTAGLAAGAKAGDAYLAQREAETRATAAPDADPPSKGGSTPANAGQFMNYLMTKHGLSKVQAAGVVGNLVQESGLRATGAVGDGGTAFGLAQWRGGRLVNLKRFAGGDWTDPYRQLDFLMHEMGTSESAAGRMLRAAGDVDAATAAMISFERPKGWTAENPRGGHGWKNRLSQASRLAGRDVPEGTVMTTHGLPALSDTPLQLRHDGTIRGDAYDAAAIRAYAWRMEAGVATDLANAWDEHKDDPAGFARRMGEIRDHYLKDENLAEPGMREAFVKNFTQRAETYGRDVAARQEKRLKDEEEAAATTALDARRGDIERQAYALGGNPEGDRILSGQMEQAGRAIDAAAASGAISPAQAAQRRADLAETTARARTQGVFDALPSPEDKERFATALLDDWAKGEGPLAQMPLATVQALSATLFSRARQEGNEKRAGNAVRLAELKRLAGDDLASMEATGQGLDLTRAGSSMSEMAAGLGEAGFADWTAKRATAQRAWQAGAGMETETEGQIAARLERLAPKAGTAGYDEASRIFEATAKKAETILKARASDPASAAQDAFPKVAELAKATDPADPAAMQALLTARLTAQEALGIDELNRQPLTRREALALAAAVTKEPDAGRQTAAMRALAEQAAATYGNHADAVMRQILEAQGIDKEMAAQGAAFFRRALDGKVTGSPAEQRAKGVATETGAADRAGQPRARDAFPLPNYQQEQMLLGQPELAPQFDAKFGAGAANRVLGRRQSGTSRKVPGGMATVDKSGEGFIPDGR